MLKSFRFAKNYAKPNIMTEALGKIFPTNLSTIFLYIQTLIRLILSIYAICHQQITIFAMIAIIPLGIINDVVTLIYIRTPIHICTIISSLLPNKINLLAQGIGSFFAIALIYFCSFCEFHFWEEFSTRFNFIAVDYLVYTHEILHTVKESFSIPLALTCILLLAMVTFAFCYKNSPRKSIKHQLGLLIIYISINTAVFHYYTPLTTNSSTYSQELSKNGVYELFSAFRNNELDYLKFYPTLPNQEAIDNVRRNILAPDEKFIKDNTIERINTIEQNSKNYNVVLIIVESLSAEFMARFGNTQNITPFLDQLSNESMFFTNYYATGTRTVRGLEAILLSVPPTCGSSIVRRPNTDNLFTVGYVMKNAQYDTSFIYGGFAYFDNMLEFFSTNGYQCIDRSNLTNQEITFSTVWGVADEDIFKKAISYYDQQAEKQKPFFSVLLTTSNHRPFLFPQDKIDLAAGSRQAGVKYTDYAIKEFIKTAQTKPWFKDTIFVISADHCASCAGKTKLPIHKYHIPLFIYAPDIIKPQIVDNLSSQIDLMPTVLGLLGINYQSKFFGQDILKHPANRAFISTYQLLGYLKNDKLIVLAPQQKPEVYNFNGELLPAQDKDLIKEAIGFYQSAYILFKQGEMKTVK